MGFFSQECHHCHKSIISPYSMSKRNAWMTKAVVIVKEEYEGEHSVLCGEYDGYGRLETGDTSYEDAIGWDNTVYHFACWELIGKPRDYKGPSPHARDQGYFFDDKDYDIPDPRGVT